MGEKQIESIKIMNEQELLNIIKSGESSTVQFKERLLYLEYIFIPIGINNHL